MNTETIETTGTKPDTDNGAAVVSHGGFGSLELPDIGLGTHRTSGTYIALLLTLEDSREDRAGIIADVCEHLGMRLEDIAAYRDWQNAGGWCQPHTKRDVPPPRV